jgi:hypothetical protein
MRRHISTPLTACIASLEARLSPRPEAEPSPFANQDVVAEVEQAAEQYQAYLSRIAERWRVASEDFDPWEDRPAIQKLITAATPEQVEEAARLLHTIRERRHAGQNEYFRRREEQYFAEYERQKRQRELTDRANARRGTA